MNVSDKSICCLLYCIVALLNGLNAQSRDDLEKERNAIIEQIELTSKNLEKAQKNESASLEDLKAIEAQISSREKLIQNIKTQLQNADNAIDSNSKEVADLNQDLSGLKAKYYALANKAYIKKIGENKWVYLLSSEGLNDAFLRWRYIKQFEKYVSVKTSQVELIKSNIHNKTNTIIEEKDYVQKLLIEEEKNFKKLEKDKKRKDKILKKLQSQSNELKQELDRKKAEREKLNIAIEKVILEELSKKRKSDKSETTSSGLIAKKKLSWPCDGYISGKFGKQKHPTLKNVTINNNGIDITSKANSTVTSVANGTIISISTIPGYDNMVIVQHGKFYSVYSKLDQVNVSRGQSIKVGDTIGKLGIDESPQLHFELWKEKQKLNPMEWLIKR